MFSGTKSQSDQGKEEEQINTHEFELRYVVQDHAPVLSALKKLDAKIKGKLSQRDYYFTPPSLDVGEKGSVVRVREDVHKEGKRRIALSYKTPNKPVGGVEAREEIEVDVLGDVHTLIELLKRIKVKPIVSVKKERTEYTLTYKGTSFTVTLDQVETLGSFVEIELLSGRKGDVQRLIALGEELAAKLNIDISKKIGLGYHELMLMRKTMRPEPNIPSKSGSGGAYVAQ